MGRRGRTDMKQRNNQHVQKRIMDSEDSDEDYVAEVDEVDDQSEELDTWVADASEEESCFEAEGGEEEEEEDEELEEEEDGRENGRRTIVKPKPKPKTKPKAKPKSKPNIQRGSAKFKKNRASRPKKRTKVTCNSDDSNEEDDDDYDDEEFTPDEIEHLEKEEEDDDDVEEEEEEDFLPVRRKSKKRGRPSLKGKKAMKSKRRKRTIKVVKKPSKKRSIRTGSSRRMAKSDEDEDFFDSRNLRGRTKRKSVRRKKRVKVGSDSDFCSDSSDSNFTISEEEREQIREANELCRTLPTNLRSSRRIPEEDNFSEPKIPSARKGKEKAEEKKNDTGKPLCGICLTEEGKNTIRGMLNCCNHYFCFACIMQWSKVETRCPLCKQRFVTISKQARCSKGFDLRDAVVSVPERDQVYQPSEEELRDLMNPYENVICTECHQGGDDALMLLCDLCDSPAHTYCVGLGQEVPEGNWYCDGCRPAAEGNWYCDGCRPAALASSHTQTEDLFIDQGPGAGAFNEQSTYENMAEIDLNVTIPEPPVSQGIGFLSSPRFLGGNFQAPSPASGMGVSTVSGRRRIHRQIQYILSNRRSQNGGDISSLGNLISLGFNQHQRSWTTEVGTPLHAHQANGSLEALPNNGQNSDFRPEREGHLTGPLDQRSRTADSSVNSHLLWGVSSSQPQSSASEQQLGSCSSRSSIEPGIPSDIRDEYRSNLLKQEVHSLVRSQLRSINLSDSDYIEISRRSVCTIMAAYGLEPGGSDAFEMRLPNCTHLDDGLVVGFSPLKDCCLSCFQGFVKEVVTRVKDMILPSSHWLGFR